MTAQPYRTRPARVEALKWTGDNADEVKAFAGVRTNGDCRFLLPGEITGVWDHPHVYDEQHGIWAAIPAGYWAVKTEQGFEVYSPEEFAARFEPDTWEEDLKRDVAVVRKRVMDMLGRYL